MREEEKRKRTPKARERCIQSEMTRKVCCQGHELGVDHKFQDIAYESSPKNEALSQRKRGWQRQRVKEISRGHNQCNAMRKTAYAPESSCELREERGRWGLLRKLPLLLL